MNKKIIIDTGTTFAAMIGGIAFFIVLLVALWNQVWIAVIILTPLVVMINFHAFFYRIYIELDREKNICSVKYHIGSKLWKKRELILNSETEIIFEEGISSDSEGSTKYRKICIKSGVDLIRVNYYGLDYEVQAILKELRKKNFKITQIKI